MESIRNLWFKSGILLAPMVRLNTTPFRVLCLRHGADVAYTEEIISFKLQNCKRIENSLLNTVDFVSEKDGVVLRIADEEKGRLILQIGANNPEVALKAAAIV